MGNVAYAIDGRGNITVYTYDEQDNLIGVSSYAKVKEEVYKLTDTTRYTYDKNGNMKTQEINGIVTNTFNYNARNLVKEKEYPGNSNNVVTSTYYADGNVKEVIDRKNIKTQYKYNPQGLVVEEKAVQIGANGTEQSYTKKNYEYDPTGNQLKSILISSTTTEVVERTYDELGRVKTKGVSNVEGKILYIYDIVTSDGLTAETSIDQKNNITTKVYDKAGRLAFVKNGDINAENIAEYDYYKNGAAKSVIYAGGAREDYIYYPDGRLKSLVNTDNKGVAFESYVYTYDANGNMLSKEDKKGITTYTYDNLNRLKTVDEKYSGKVTEYTYDKLGNRSTATIKENGIIKEEVYNYNLDLNQLKSVITKKNGVAISITNYEYDANGNLTSSVTDGEKNTYAYDEFNQLINADGAKYGYNAEGLRVSKNVNGSLTRYIYEYDKVVLEIDAAGNQVGRNIYGTNLLMRTADGQSYYYMYNGHADVTALINASTGNIDATYYYDAFGNIVEANGVAKDKNSILYAGYQYDKETGLYYLNARMYDPKIARFLQEDTYTGDPNDPLSLNLYTYCANNPLIYYDPTGHSWISDKINDYKEAFRILFLASEEERYEAFRLIYEYGDNSVYTNVVTSIAYGMAEAGDAFKDPVKQMEENNAILDSVLSNDLGLKDSKVYNIAKKVFGKEIKKVEAGAIYCVNMVKGVGMLGYSIANNQYNQTKFLFNTASFLTGNASYEAWQKSAADYYNSQMNMLNMPANIVLGAINDVGTLLNPQKAYDFFINPDASLASIAEYQSAGLNTAMWAIPAGKALPKFKAGFTEAFNAAWSKGMSESYALATELGPVGGGTFKPQVFADALRQGIKGGISYIKNGGNAIVGKSKPEVYVRYSSEAEALATKEAGGLVPKIHNNGSVSRGAKWISEEGKSRVVRNLGKTSNYTYKITMKLKAGTKQWLESMAIMYDELIGGESNNAGNVFLKSI